MKKCTLLLILLTILYPVLTSLPRIADAEAPFLATGTIYIRADGRVDPPDSPISSLDNMTYMLSADIVWSCNQSGIVVERDDIIVEGAGYTVQGIGRGYGIDLTNRTNVTIKNMKIKSFFHGIYLWHSANSSITKNNITACTVSGIRLFRFSYYNNISRNNMANNANGIGLVDSVGNRIFENSIEHNGLNIELFGSHGNLIYDNNFLNNASQQVHTFNKNHLWDFWDAGYPSGGNYWSSYNSTDSFCGIYQNATGSDGIGDSAFAIDVRNIDHYPLMGMFHGFNTIYDHQVSIISNSSISNFDFSPIDSTYAMLSFNVSGENGTQGFCRVCIPKVLINGSYTVMFDGASITSITYPQVRELPCSNETQEYLYINYTQSEHMIEISGVTTVPEFSSFTILLVLMILTLLAAIVYRFLTNSSTPEDFPRYTI